MRALPGAYLPEEVILVNKLKLPLVFTLVVLVVLSLYAEERHRQALTATDAAINPAW